MPYNRQSKSVLNVERDADGMAHIVGLSGGKDSVGMAVLLKEREPRPYTYVCTPTGSELPAMVAHLDRLEAILGKPLIRLTNGTLQSVIHDNNMLPNAFARFCTRILKLRPYGEFMAAVSPAISYIGLRADEDDREGVRPGGDYGAINNAVTQDFPLRRWGIGIEEIWQTLDARGITIPERTDCAWCPYQTIGEWYNLWNRHIDIYLAAEAEELRTGHTFRSPTGHHGPWPHDLKGLRLEFEKGRIPERSLRMMEKRRGMCRACSL